MLQFIIRKVLYAFIVLWGVVSITFIITSFMLPGDPARLQMAQRADAETIEAIRRQMGLDRPWYERYTAYLGDLLLRADLGRSFATNRDVVGSILERIPASALLAGSAMTFATLLGVLIGIVSALRPHSALDAGTMSAALLGISLPSYVTGPLLALVFVTYLGLLPPSGYINRGWEHLLLPMITLGIRPLSIIARVTRSAMLETMSLDYIRTARSKGLGEAVVVLKHALRNAMNPVITTISGWVAAVLAGTFFIEFIFYWPGIGLLTINAINQLDYPMIQGTVLFTALIFVVINLIVDILYAFLDPRVKVH